MNDIFFTTQIGSARTVSSYRFPSPPAAAAAAAAAGADITYFMGNPVNNRSACVAQGVLQQFFQVRFVLPTLKTVPVRCACTTVLAA